MFVFFKIVVVKLVGYLPFAKGNSLGFKETLHFQIAKVSESAQNSRAWFSFFRRHYLKLIEMNEQRLNQWI